MGRDNFRDTIGVRDATTGAYIILSGIEVRILKAGTSTPANVYSSRSTNVTTPLTQPLTTNNTGVINFWADTGDYDIAYHDTIMPARIADQSHGWNSSPMGDNGLATKVLAKDGGIDLASLIVDIQARLFRPGCLQATMENVDSSTQPGGWLFADGRAVSRAGFPNLFSAIGTSAGSGDGSTTFNLPDLCGRALVGAGSGAGLTARSRGSKFGEESVVLTTGQIPAHNHGTLGAQPAGFIQQGTGTGANVTFGGGGFVSNPTTANTGGGDGHPNVPPSFGANWLIKI